MKLLILSSMLLLAYPCFSQIKKVQGYTGNIPYSCSVKFQGSYFTVERQDGYAIADLDGNMIITGIKAPVVEFTKEIHIDYNIYFAKEGNNIVLKNLSGKTLGTGKYSQITPFITDNTIVQLQSAPGTIVLAYIDTTGKEIVRFDKKQYSAIANPSGKKTALAFISLSNFVPYSNGLTLIKSDELEKYGFIDKKLKLVIPFAYRNACPFSEGLAAVQNNDGIWGYIDTHGKLIIPYTYSHRPFRFSSGLAKVKNNDGDFGYINKANKLVIPAKYKNATHFYKGYALVREAYNGIALLIDSTGNTIASFPKGAQFINEDESAPGISAQDNPDPPFYTSETLRQLVDEGKGIFKKGMHYGLIDKKGNIILDFNYNFLSDYHNGKMFAYKSEFINQKTQHEYGIIDETGKMIVNVVKPEF